MSKKKSSTGSQTLLEAFRSLLLGKKASSQEALCKSLEKQGFAINQSKVSRLLRKIGAIKIVNVHGETVYSLPKEPVPPSMNTSLSSLILDIVANEVMVVIFTSPGSASMVARVLDHAPITAEILGTIAGDDTVFVAPKSIKEIPKLVKEIKDLLKA